MQIQFHIEDPSCLKATEGLQISDTLDATLFECHGETVVRIGGTVLEDRLEVIIRLSEILENIERLLDDNCPRGSFRFQFEGRVQFKKEGDRISFYDRESHGAHLESCSKEEIADIKMGLLKSIREDIAPLSPVISQELIAGNLKYA